MQQLGKSAPLLIGPESRIGLNTRPVGGQANPSWSRPSYLARFRQLHALSVGTVAEALARTRLAAQRFR